MYHLGNEKGETKNHHHHHHQQQLHQIFANALRRRADETSATQSVRELGAISLTAIHLASRVNGLEVVIQRGVRVTSALAFQ